ncbi:hypothetical protein BD779DRAFT_238867 [Infundibulicybe gibba]|nr:hypothetical protein BD779DRAFT_238867 [Infundibulicybe gibba]
MTNIKANGGEFVPRGWIVDVEAPQTLETMFANMSELDNVQIRLKEDKGSLLLFSAGDKQYFWNLVTQEGSEVLEPTDYDELLEQIDKDITKVRVQALPEPDDLEG